MVELGQSTCIRTKVVVIGQSGYLGKSGCIQAKAAVFGQSGCFRAKVVVF